MDIVATIGGWGVAIVLALIALLPRKGTIENTRLDQLQEDLEAERTERKALGAEVKELRTDVDMYRGRDLAWMQHYSLIQHGVETGTIPPWPDLPIALRGDQ